MRHDTQYTFSLPIVAVIIVATMSIPTPKNMHFGVRDECLRAEIEEGSTGLRTPRAERK